MDSKLPLAAGLLFLLPGVSRAEPLPTQVTTDIFVLGVTPDPYSAYSADRMIVLADGSRLVEGSGCSNSACPFFLMKVAPDGTSAWAAPVADLFDSEVTGLAADAAGDAFVSYTDFSNFSQPRALVVKFSAAAGLAVSTADLTANAAGGDGYPFSAGVGADPSRGRVYAAYSYYSAAQSQNTFALATLDENLASAGAPRVYDPGFRGSFGVTPGGGVLVDGAGNAWVVASQAPPGADGQLAAVRFPRGAAPAALTIPSPLVEETCGAADPRGGLVAAGDRQWDGSLYLHRVSSSGVGAPFRFDGFDDVPTPMAVDPRGVLYIADYDPVTGEPAIAKVGASNALAWDSPGPYLDLPDAYAPGAVAAASTTSFDVAGASFDSDPSPVVLYHYEAAGSPAPSELLLAAVSPLDQDATVTKSSTTLTVRVTENGSPKSGATVEWDFVSVPDGASGQDLLEAPGFPSTVVASRDVLTNAAGDSSVQVKLGDKTGSYRVVAKLSGATSSQIPFSLRGKLYLEVRLSTSSIKPVPFTNIVSADDKVSVTAHAFGIGGAADAVADYPLVLVSTPVAFSGGHDHDAGRPDGKFSGTGLTVHTTSATGRTDASGDLFAVFTSTFFGGDELFYASSTIDASVVSISTGLVIKTGGFVLLPDATYYIMDGGRALHHGPKCKDKAIDPTCDSPDRDHYATPATAKAIAAIAAGWLATHPNQRMEINDMSLPLGGGFDVGGHWTADIVDEFPDDPMHCNRVGHCEHRDGRVADIQLEPNTPPNNLPAKARTELKDLLRKHHVRWHIEGSHWHIKF
jgi:hypothetical protein